MNNRERVQAIFSYKSYDRMPVVHFGLWNETLAKWVSEGHISEQEAEGHIGGNPPVSVMERLGFDFGWPGKVVGANYGFRPPFTEEVIEELEDGSKKIRNRDGVVVMQVPGATSIPAEVDHLLKDRQSWEEHYLPRLQFSEERINTKYLESLRNEKERDYVLAVSCGSMIGRIRDWLGVVGLSFLWMDDPGLFDEILDTYFNLIYRLLKRVLATGVQFDFGFFWEDICFNSGPLVVPSVFDEKCGPHYRKITELLKKHGVNMSSLDCDGMIDALIPTWLENGVNIMFPIEVGTWNASIKPWREKYGPELCGVGGMDKRVFGKDYAAVDAEIERLKPLIELGGYIPCPDHRIPPDAKWENVQYYCDKMRELF